MPSPYLQLTVLVGLYHLRCVCVCLEGGRRSFRWGIGVLREVVFKLSDKFINCMLKGALKKCSDCLFCRSIFSSNLGFFCLLRELKTYLRVKLISPFYSVNINNTSCNIVILKFQNAMIRTIGNCTKYMSTNQNFHN